MDIVAKFLLYVGATFLLGGVFVRRALFDYNNQIGFLFTGLLFLAVGGSLSIWLPLAELELNVPEVILEYMATIAAGRAVVIMLLGAVLLILFEMTNWSRVTLLGAAAMTLWGLAGIGHGGDHAPWLRLTHVVHAGGMVVWLSGVLSVWRAEDMRIQAMRFAPYALSAVGTLVLSGLLLTSVHAGFPLLMRTEYVQVLSMKLAGFGILLAIATRTHFYFGGDFYMKCKVLARKVTPFLIMELLLLLVILFLTAKVSISPMPG